MADAEDLYESVLAKKRIDEADIKEHQPTKMDCDKKNRFLSSANQLTLLKEMYSRHVRDGGTRTSRFFADQLPWLMKKWDQLDKLDSYESLIDDPVSELIAINKEFLKDHEATYAAGGDFKTLTPTYKMGLYDYRSLDIRGTGSDDKVVDKSLYRFGNAIPLYQKTGSSGIGRHLDVDGSRDGIHGRSLNVPISGYDMSAILAAVDKPYKKVDTLTEQYYGHTEYSADGGTVLLDTGWE